ncbi:MAG: ankyrin repeat domain-containing protein [Desulfurobacteriaceae bacterium]
MDENLKKFNEKKTYSKQNTAKEVFTFIAIIFPLAFLFYVIYVSYQKSQIKPLLSNFLEGKNLSISEYEKLYNFYGINLKDKEGNTLLHRLTLKVCSQKMNSIPPLIPRLLKDGLSPNERNRKGQTPLHLAAAYCKDEDTLKKLLSLFLKFGGDINAKDCAGNTPLFYTIDYDAYNPQIRTLLKFNPNVNVKNYYGWTPLCKAAFFDIGTSFQLLQKYGGNIREKCGEVSIPELVKTLSSRKVANYLEKLGIGFKEIKELKGNLKKLLFKSSINTFCVKEDFEKNIENAVAFSIYFDQADRVKAFFKHSLFSLNSTITSKEFPDTKLKSFSPLLLAVYSKSCSPKVLSYFLTLGVNPNKRLENGKTLLHICVERGCVECAKLLIENGADVHLKDKKGFTPYCIAVANGRKRVVKELLTYGANPKDPCVEMAKLLREMEEFSQDTLW